MDNLLQLASDPRVSIRRAGMPDPDGTCVLYWMQRAQRGTDNPALDVAVRAANLLGKPAVVFFALKPSHSANLRHYAFLVQGILDIAEALKRRGIGFVLRRSPEHSLQRLCEELRPAFVVGDESPLRAAESRRQRAARKLRVPFWTVDADVIVPSKLLGKAQYAARIIRPRLSKLLERFLVPCRDPKAKVVWKKPRALSSLPPGSDLLRGWPINRSVQAVRVFRGGSGEAQRLLKEFVQCKLASYPRVRNHPEDDGTSRLSPYLHFGHIGPNTVALAVARANAPKAAKEAFLDQLITWRELAVNFVRYNPNYDNFECAEPWAHRTLAEHGGDLRPVLYNEQQLESAETHDPLWNAAQRQMVNHGWMHNYLRMYWGKKILEWSPSAAEAFEIAVRLNDKYELDGRDPNGYAGIAWAIVGKFDRAWSERPMFGKIRFMSLASTGKKFDSERYVERNS
jgi:deoxyribodipyrimidine photo-lyase